MLPVLVNVAFFTLLERKILGLRQLRQGPNKVGVGGILQPFSDAVKLFMKENLPPLGGYQNIFWIPPLLAFLIVSLIWWICPRARGHRNRHYSVALFLVFLSLNVYPLFFAGWSSNRKYALLGSTRGIAQSVSYEISLALFLLTLLCVRHTLDLRCVFYDLVFSYIFLCLPLLFFWVVCCVAETNRSPFDFAEGESELVSGFNIEYGAGGFALIFMAEYARILVLSYLRGLLFFSFKRALSRVSLIIFLGFFWVWLRCTYPRFRYDKLILLSWKRILPASLALARYFLPLSVA